MGESENVYLRQISEDLNFLKKKVMLIEERVEEISDDMHEVRPEYLEKLKNLDSGPSKKYKNLEDFEKSIKKD